MEKKFGNHKKMWKNVGKCGKMQKIAKNRKISQKIVETNFRSNDPSEQTAHTKKAEFTIDWDIIKEIEVRKLSQQKTKFNKEPKNAICNLNHWTHVFIS